MDRFKNLWKTITDLFENNRRVFCHLATKLSFGLLFFFGLVFPLFKTTSTIPIARFNAFDILLGWVWVIAFFILPLLILWFSLLKKDRKANQLFKTNTILAIMFYIWVIISFVVLATDPSLPKFTLGFGFYLATISITGLILLAWKQELLMNFIYKVFKVPEIQEVEYVEKEIPAEEPKEVEKPVIAKEPVPTPEPEPTLEPVVEAPKEEKVEEPTPASKPIAKDQI